MTCTWDLCWWVKGVVLHIIAALQPLCTYNGLLVFCTFMSWWNVSLAADIFSRNILLNHTDLLNTVCGYSCILISLQVTGDHDPQFKKHGVHNITHLESVNNVSIYRLSQEECARLREGVPHGKVYRYNPKHLYPKLNGYGDNGQRKVWSSSGSMHCSYQLTHLINVCPWMWYGIMSLLASDVSCIVLGNPKTTMTQLPAFL
jgi:hypothetical protein